MLYKTRGIVLHSVKYGDTSCIAHIYTEMFGRQAYMVKGAYSKKASVKANLFYPLNLLEMEIYHKPGSNLQKIKEAQNLPMYSQIPFHPQKNAIVLFIAEILYRTLREEEPNIRLFNFIFSALLLLDLKTSDFTNFHLLFMLQLTKFSGFYPNNNYSSKYPVFDLINGHFVTETPLHGHFIHQNEAVIFTSLIGKEFNHLETIKLSREMRLYLLDKLVKYYQLHVEGMGKIKSLQVLKEVFD